MGEKMFRKTFPVPVRLVSALCPTRKILIFYSLGAHPFRGKILGFV
ncbi:unnamed protein product [Callosobruchus maculatus]|uniref:Uncharacterized protein n=1 Tax=Callosobruchus maculatus TaxID=64391 RepID=A0A653C0D6_CALMS|nr:unnamed protein product [Callosobruchus maculatus]